MTEVQLKAFKETWTQLSREFGKEGISSTLERLAAAKVKFVKGEAELAKMPGAQNLARYQAVQKEVERITAAEDLLRVRAEIQARIDKEAKGSRSAMDRVGAEMKLTDEDPNFKALKSQEEVAETLYSRLSNDLQELMMRLLGADPNVDSKLPKSEPLGIAPSTLPDPAPR
jgi:hypothetical protein